MAVIPETTEAGGDSVVAPPAFHVFFHPPLRPLGWPGDFDAVVASGDIDRVDDLVHLAGAGRFSSQGTQVLVSPMVSRRWTS